MSDSKTATEELDLYCSDCDTLSQLHRRTSDGWACSSCGTVKECSNPQWSERCNDDLNTPQEARKGLCSGCLSVIDSWSDGDESADDSEQTTLLTDGGGDAK